MKRVCTVVLVILVAGGIGAESFGFGGLGFGRGSYQDWGNLWLADRMGAFTPPADPFADRRQPNVPSGGGYAPVPAAPYPTQPVTPQVSAIDLMNPATGGLANLGRTMSAGQLKTPYVPPPAFQQPSPGYALPSDMGMHSVSSSALPR